MTSVIRCLLSCVRTRIKFIDDLAITGAAGKRLADDSDDEPEQDTAKGGEKFVPKKVNPTFLTAYAHIMACGKSYTTAMGASDLCILRLELTLANSLLSPSIRAQSGRPIAVPFARASVRTSGYAAASGQSASTLSSGTCTARFLPQVPRQ